MAAIVSLGYKNVTVVFLLILGISYYKDYKDDSHMIMWINVKFVWV